MISTFKIVKFYIYTSHILLQIYNFFLSKFYILQLFSLDKLLNKTGIDVNVKDFSGWNPLYTAVSFNKYNVYAVSRLLASSGIQVNCTTTCGMTPLMLSARICHVEALKVMLEDPRVVLDIKDEAGDGLEEVVGL